MATRIDGGEGPQRQQQHRPQQQPRAAALQLSWPPLIESTRAIDEHIGRTPTSTMVSFPPALLQPSYPIQPTILQTARRPVTTPLWEPSPSPPETIYLTGPTFLPPQNKDSHFTSLHLHRARDADLFESFAKDRLPADDIYVPAHHQPVNPEDEDDVVPDQHAAFGIQKATLLRREPAWRDFGLGELMAKGPEAGAWKGAAGGGRRKGGGGGGAGAGPGKKGAGGASRLPR